MWEEICEETTPPCALTWIADENCFHLIPYASPAVAVVEDQIEEITNWQFEATAGRCGASFVRAGNDMSCFRLNPEGMCITSFPPTVSYRPAFVVIYLSGVFHDVTLERTPLTLKAQFAKSILPLRILVTESELEIHMELVSLHRCTPYPPTLIDSRMGHWILQEREQICDATVSALYSSTRSLEGITPISSNETHDHYRFDLGGMGSTCNGKPYCLQEGIVAQYSLARPPVVPPRYDSAPDILMGVVLAPVGIMIGLVTLSLLWLKATKVFKSPLPPMPKGGKSS